MSVLLAFVGYFVLGALWFTVFFSKPYRVSLGRKNETLASKPIFIIGPAVCSLVITLTCAILINTLHISTLGEIVEFTWLIGVGLLVANTLNIAINPNIPHPIYYGIISGGYHLVGILIVSIILVTMK
jgi:hypothetical protein